MVTVTYFSGDHLVTFLRSLDAVTDVMPQVIIADNGSDDGAPERAEQEYDTVTLVRTGGNIGYGGAVNRGVAETDTEFVVVANPDVEWTPKAIDLLLAEGFLTA